MKRKTRKIITWVIVGILSVSLLGGTFYGGWQSLKAANSQDDLYKSEIASYKQKLEEDPKNAEFLKALGNLYYDYGVYLYQKGKNDQAEEQFKQAVSSYKQALEVKEDANTYVDMATAAFYIGWEDEAVKGFEAALKLNPEHFNGYYNYGIFLALYKNDYEKAIEKLEMAKKVAQTEEGARKAEELIAQLTEMQKQKQLEGENDAETDSGSNAESSKDPNTESSKDSNTDSGSSNSNE